MADNYLRRIEALENELVPAPIERPLIAYLHDGDTRPADWMELLGQRFDRGADEKEDNFPQRVLESLGLADRNVRIVHYVRRREWRTGISSER